MAHPFERKSILVNNCHEGQYFHIFILILLLRYFNAQTNTNVAYQYKNDDIYIVVVLIRLFHLCFILFFSFLNNIIEIC